MCKGTVKDLKDCRRWQRVAAMEKQMPLPTTPRTRIHPLSLTTTLTVKLTGALTEMQTQWGSGADAVGQMQPLPNSTAGDKKDN